MTNEDLPFFYRLTIVYEHDPKYPQHITYVFPATTDILDEVWNPDDLGRMSKADRIDPVKITMEEVYINSDWSFECHETEFEPAWEILIDSYRLRVKEQRSAYAEEVRELSKERDAGVESLRKMMEQQANKIREVESLQWGYGMQPIPEGAIDRTAVQKKYEDDIREEKLRWIAEAIKQKEAELERELCRDPLTP